MLTLIMTIITISIMLVIMYLTDNNRKRYNNYQINKILKQLKLYQLQKE